MKQRSGILVIAMLLLFGLVGNLHAEAVVTAGTNYNNTTILPLRDFSTTIIVNDQVATTIIDQTFYNREDFADAQYHYPLPSRATITGFGIYINDEIEYFDLTPSPDDSGHGGSSNMPADLRDFLGPNPFVAPLSNVPVEEYFTLRLEYTELMDYSFGSYSLIYPARTAPFQSTDLVDMNIDIFVSSQRAIQTINIDGYNAIIQHQTADSAAVHLEEHFFTADEDVSFSMSVDQEDVGMWVMATHAENAERGHFLAVLEPGEVTPGEISQKTFTFIIDRSGSMAGNKIREAKQAAIYCIEHLQPGDFFNLISFASEVTQWQGEPLQVNPTNIASASEYINSIIAEGSTNLNGAMLAALNQEMGDNTANQILLLSDGYPTAGVTSVPAILQNISEANDQDVSIFTVGVGPIGNYGEGGLEFLQLIAYENNGLPLHIVPGTVDISDAISDFFLRFASPVLTNVSLSFGELQVISDEVYPRSPYNLFAGWQTVITGEYIGAGSHTIEVNATVSGHDTTIVYGPFDFPEVSDDFAFVPRMWAIEKIDYWLAWMAANGEDDEIVDMIIELSILYGILTPYTSYDTDFPTAMGDELALAARTTTDGNYLSWHAPAGMQDVSYDIYRRSLDGQAWIKLNGTPVTSTTFFDRTAVPGVGYVYRVVMRGDDVKAVVEEIRVDGEKQASFELESIHPNPFNERTQVRFQLATDSRVRIDVYDILGRQVATLHDGTATTGRHAVSLDASRLSSGLYFLRMQATSLDGSGTSSRMARITLVK